VSNILRVSQLNRYVKSKLEGDSLLQEVYISGEIGTLSLNARSGHIYFTLKEGESTVKAVMFAGNAKFLRFAPKTGLAVIARASVSLYEKDGTFQIIVSELMIDGGSSLGFAFEKQKLLLEKKGYFAQENKKAIPENPAVIGIVTSETGAALHDIIITIERINPSVTVILAPSAVQGKEAADSIAKAIAQLNTDGRSEVIIVGRGGGSAEDLWSFNEEAVVKAVFESKIPVISAVGHETDVTLCDLAADVRAATPTAAAQIAVIERTNLLNMLSIYKYRLDTTVHQRINAKEEHLFSFKNNEHFKTPQFFINKNRQILNNLILLMNKHTEVFITKRTDEIAMRAAVLESVSPLKILSRGYCVAQNNSTAVTSVDSVKTGDSLKIIFSDGSVNTTVTEKEKADYYDF